MALSKTDPNWKPRFRYTKKTCAGDNGGIVLLDRYPTIREYEEGMNHDTMASETSRGAGQGRADVQGAKAAT